MELYNNLRRVDDNHKIFQDKEFPTVLYNLSYLHKVFQTIITSVDRQNYSNHMELNKIELSHECMKKNEEFSNPDSDSVLDEEELSTEEETSKKDGDSDDADSLLTTHNQQFHKLNRFHQLTGRNTENDKKTLPYISIEDVKDETKNKKKLIGVDGIWYDVSSFAQRHPGGNVIEKFINADATSVFMSMHGSISDELKFVRSVGWYRRPIRHTVDVEIENLVMYFRENGFLHTNPEYYIKKVLVIFAMFFSSWFFVVQFQQNYLFQLFGAVIMAFFFQQCGFIMHEFHHTQIFRQKKYDWIFGVFFGAGGFGISSHWWKEEHDVHHSLTNVIGLKERFADPQMWETCFVQNEKIFGLFKITDAFQRLLIRYQHWLFVPIVTFIGRFEIVTDSFKRERRVSEWIGCIVHWTWMIYLLSFLPSVKLAIVFYLVMASTEGIFHFELILSHYAKSFAFVDNLINNDSWYVFQTASNLNLITWRFMDWFYGGLNFHIEHHLFPKMARNKMRTASPIIKEVMMKHGVYYEEMTLCESLWYTLKHLKEKTILFSLEIR
ncbi:hypothetical protein SNEBB_011004 [Seison nebaliae]|nr:hypothetical protein SNEBB_011004 [Seison nebaliae]